MNWMMMLVVLLGGGATAVQAGVNGALGRKVGTIEGAFTSFLIGTVALFLIMMFLGKGNVLQIVSLPKWQLTGGLLGALYVIGMVFAVPKIGVASSMVAVIAGQLLTSTILDHFGVMSGKPIPIDWQRVLGIVLLAAALFLFYKK
ncbi:DMT family transporter [Paenibacillus hemerocallicola]|jgi:transporter family-2 protein|uniref:DMT family transporter n=1 Tax=Paenibacillus hemerocallicola TaxID=1172614 RepID=A0A5C4SZG9_9BACL|nr:DMT family transporter [Paenibacillus hemerocallicola]TNJ60622.1 DMT family transporter [Paenibacillus hemerocallicola]